MAHNYTHADVLQALAAALNFGWQGLGQRGTDEDGNLRAYQEQTIRVSPEARALISEAREMIGEQGDAFGMYRYSPPYRFGHRDMERAVREYLNGEPHVDEPEGTGPC